MPKVMSYPEVCGPKHVLLASLLMVLALMACSSVGMEAERSPQATEAGAPRETADQVRPGENVDLPLLSGEEALDLLRSNAAKPRFDGHIHGWRIAPNSVLEEEGSQLRGLTRSCKTTAAGPETPTTFDFSLGYVPRQIAVGPVQGPFKSLCENEPINVLTIYNVSTPLGNGQLWIERSLESAPTLELDVPEDSVEGGVINGRPAIIVHPYDDATGFGIGRVVIIEDDSGPEYRVLSVIADNGFPFDELMKLVEGIK